MPELSDKQLQARKPPRLPRAAAAAGTCAAAGLCRAALPHQLQLPARRFASARSWWQRAYNLGYRALAITDECSVAGVVRAHVGLREHSRPWTSYEHEHPEEPPLPRNPDFRLLFGSEFRFERFTLVAIAHDLEGWGNLCEFITAARTAGAQGRVPRELGRQRLASLRRLRNPVRAAARARRMLSIR